MKRCFKNIKNRIIYEDKKIIKFLIESKKYGLHEVIIDVDDYDKIKLYTWCVVYVKNILNRVATQKNCISLHKLITGYKMSDHINRIVLDNRKENLRECTNNENAKNREKAKKNTSGYKGVVWHSRTQKWQTQIKVNYKNIYVGLFENKKDAALAYNFAAIKYHKDFACLNEV